MTRTTDQRGMVAAMIYDKRGLLVRRDIIAEYPETVRDTYGYDGTGRMTLAKRESGSPLTLVARSDRAYDAMGNLAMDTQTLAGMPAKALEYGYDQAGNRTNTTYPADLAVSLDYEFDPLNPDGRKVRLTLDVMASASVNQADQNAYRHAVAAGRLHLPHFGIEVVLQTGWYEVPTPVVHDKANWFLDYVNLPAERDAVSSLATPISRADHRIYLNINSAQCPPFTWGCTWPELGLTILNQNVWASYGGFANLNVGRATVAHEILHRSDLVGLGHSYHGVMYPGGGLYSHDIDADGIRDDLELDCWTAARLVRNSQVQWEDINKRYLIYDNVECCRKREADMNNRWSLLP